MAPPFLIGRTANGKNPGAHNQQPTRCSTPSARSPLPIGVVAYRAVAILMILGAAAGSSLWFSSIWVQSAQRRDGLHDRLSDYLGYALAKLSSGCLREAVLLASSPALQHAALSRDPAAIGAAVNPVLDALPAHDNLKIQLFVPPGRCLWRSWKAESARAPDRPTVRQVLETGRPAAAIEQTAAGAAVCGIAPIKDSNGRVVGAVELLRDAPDLVSMLSAGLGLPVALVLSDHGRGQSASPQPPPSGRSDAQLWRAGIYASRFPQPLIAKLASLGPSSVPHTAWADGRLYVLAASSLRDRSGNPLARVIAAQDITISEARAWGVFFLTVLGALAMLGLIFAQMARTSRFLSSRTKQISKVLDEFVQGQLPHALPRAPTRECATHIAKLERLRDQLRARQDQIERMWQCQDLMSHARDEAELCEIVWHFAEKDGVELVEIFRIDSSRAHVRRIMRRDKGLRETENPWQTPDQCRAFRKGAPVAVESVSATFACPTCVGPDEQCYLCIPLISNGVMIGLMRCAWRSPNCLSDETAQSLSSYANLLAVSLDNAYLVQQLREATLRDPLTGLYNRRFLEEYLLRFSAQLSREPQNVCVLMADLDHFKAINDNYGHEAGDMLLRALCSAISRSLREGDVACRYGGEEIAIVLPNCTAEEGLEIAERVRRAVEAEAVHLPDRMDALRATISVGVAAYPDHATDLVTLLQLADKALYAAKLAGRNRCILWQEGLGVQAAA